MPVRRVKLVYPPALVDQPILYQIIQKFGVVTSIWKADVNSQGGWLLMDLRGDDAAIDKAIDWAREQGIQVQENVS